MSGQRAAWMAAMTEAANCAMPISTRSMMAWLFLIAACGYRQQMSIEWLSAGRSGVRMGHG